MILEHGNMWSVWQQTDLFCITTNSTLMGGNILVMGAGIAQQARDRFINYGLDMQLGQGIAHLRQKDGSDFYGLLISSRWPERKLAAFQVKYQWQEDARPQLIQLSTNMLREWAEAHPDKRVDLNMPGVGCGNLLLDNVLEIVQVLPDNVHIWTFKPIQRK